MWSQIPLVREAYKGKIHKATYFLPASNQGLAYILTCFLPMNLLPMCDQAHPRKFGATKLAYQSCECLAISDEQQPPAFPEVVCPWASRAYRLETFPVYRSLKNNNLNLKHNFSHHRSGLRRLRKNKNTSRLDGL